MLRGRRNKLQEITGREKQRSLYLEYIKNNPNSPLKTQRTQNMSSKHPTFFLNTLLKRIYRWQINT